MLWYVVYITKSWTNGLCSSKLLYSTIYFFNCSPQRWEFQIWTPKTPILRHTDFIHHFINTLRSCLLHVPLFNTWKIYTFYPHCIFMWFYGTQNKLIIFISSSNRHDSAKCAVQTESLNIIMVKCILTL